MGGRARHLMLLVMAEEDVEGTGKAPQRQHQQEEEPLHIVNDHRERVNEGVLGRLQHPAASSRDAW